MKQFVNFSLLISAIVFAASLLFISCQDENNQVVEPSRILLSSMSNFRQDGTLIVKESYKYDSNGRLIEMLNSDNYKVVIEYLSSRLSMKEYDNGELSYSSDINLNEKGLCISSSADKEVTTTYTYDNNGYRQSMIELDDHSTYSKTFTVSNENYVTVITESNSPSFQPANMTTPLFLEKFIILKQAANRIPTNSLKSASEDSYIEKTDFEFYTDKTNTIEYENMGMYFLGRQNKNLVKQETHTSGNLPAYTTSYTYEYDSKGRVTKRIYDNGDYDVFSYVE